MDETILFGLLENGQHLIISYVLATIGLDNIIGHITDGNTPVLGIVTTTLTQLRPAESAGTHALGVLTIILLQPVGDPLDADRLVLRLNRLLHRNNVHPNPRTSRWYHRRNPLERQKSHPFKKGGHFRVLINLFFTHIKKLGAPGDKPR